jgi:hypothetical protein
MPSSKHLRVYRGDQVVADVPVARGAKLEFGEVDDGFEVHVLAGEDDRPERLKGSGRVKGEKYSSPTPHIRATDETSVAHIEQIFGERFVSDVDNAQNKPLSGVASGVSGDSKGKKTK